jgi:hypothetical protein
MRGDRRRQETMFIYVLPDARLAQNTANQRSAIDGRTTRHGGYRLCQRVCRRIMETFGWGKVIVPCARSRSVRWRWSTNSACSCTPPTPWADSQSVGSRAITAQGRCAWNLPKWACGDAESQKSSTDAVICGLRHIHHTRICVRRPLGRHGFMTFSTAR